ncbi:MAG: cytochrome b/b6 domain-containing protein [candidate division KSB1 bacterium]|nr:cytochrome b/b6 domain-containing protein [candidate division KSB1 bacterium]
MFLTAGIASGFFRLFSAAQAQSCLECHGQSDFVIESEAGERSLYVNAAEYRASVHGDFNCRDCHADAVGDPHPDRLAAVDCSRCHEDEATQVQKGVHGGETDRKPTCSRCHTAHAIKSAADTTSTTHPLRQLATCRACHGDPLHSKRNGDRLDHLGIHEAALQEGNASAPSCSGCHQAHRILSKADPRSPVYRANLSSTCGACHKDVAEQYQKSVHAAGLRQGEFMSATCITCHGAHTILSPDEPDSPAHPINAPDRLCAPCHDSEQLTNRVGLVGKAFQSYKDSYHGLAASRGSSVAATCGSCHGIHEIRSKSDPKSSVHPANVRKTCARCHPYAGEEFARSYSHADLNAAGRRISSVVRSVYLWLIVIVIGGMAVHNLLIWSAYLRRRLRERRALRRIRRFDRAWIIQHLVVLISFTVLAVTGFALKYPKAFWVRALYAAGMTEAIRGGLHRVAAVALIAAGLHHLYCLFFVKGWRGERSALVPRLADLAQLRQNLIHHLTLKGNPPRFGRYSYIEKVEYWALIWGTVIMAVTGAVLWFPALSTRILPAWSVQVAETIHFYEAVLAVAAIVVFHFFFVIFHPKEYPLNVTAFTGDITEEEAKEKFPGWYEELGSSKSF